MRDELASAEATLSRIGRSEALLEGLESARGALAAARENEFAALEKHRHCEQALKTLNENRTAMPSEAIAARDRYLAGGSAAVILGDAVAPLNVAAHEERVAIEGALGDLRWAVLVDDGTSVKLQRVYLAEFCRRERSRGASQVPHALFECP
jgi:hypothetical protein